MPEATVMLLHPGEMGGTVGAAAKAAGARVVWASEDRSPASRSRASAYELEDLGSIDRLVATADFVISICPPHLALEVARSVAVRRFPGVYIDANAVSPARARTMAGVIENAEAHSWTAELSGHQRQSRRGKVAIPHMYSTALSAGRVGLMSRRAI
jgi:3-hydroxyisobutyrate dehydrogenase-like beta-hydroxyacid dehydrogenase